MCVIWRVLKQYMTIKSRKTGKVFFIAGLLIVEQKTSLMHRDGWYRLLCIPAL